MPIIRKVISKRKSSRPVLIDFDNAKIKPEEVRNLQAHMYETPNKSMVAVTSDKLLYTSDVKEDDLYKNFILVHKKETNEIKLFQVDHVMVRANLFKKKLPQISPQEANNVRELNKTFGSKKLKRDTEQKERLKMNIEAVRGQLENTVANLKVETIASVTENDNIYRPKINRDASTPDGVYNIEDLVETYILDSLAMEAGAIMNSGSADQFGLYPFVTSNINKIVLSSLHEEEKVRSITIFLYIHYLMKFMTTPMKNIKKKFVLCDKSIDVNNHILSVFSENGANGRNRPLHMKDKALCYTMILAAIAMEFEVDVQLLSKDLKVGIKKAVEVARILAFNAKANNKNVVQLKLPLPAPVTYNPKRGRR